MTRVISAVRAWRVGAGSVRHSGVAATASRSEQIELLRPASTVVSKLPLASHGPLPDSGCERPLLLPKQEHSMMRAQPRRRRSPSHRAMPATPEARRYPPEGTSQPASARKPPDRTSKSAVQQSTRRVVVMAAADHIARRLLNHLMNMNDASCPRMPRIKNLALLGPMGVASSCCTTRSDRMHRSDTNHQLRTCSCQPRRVAGCAAPTGTSCMGDEVEPQPGISSIFCRDRLATACAESPLRSANGLRRMNSEAWFTEAVVPSESRHWRRQDRRA